jgi:two-component system osmolarity sensor histidine kinase EnvZ
MLGGDETLREGMHADLDEIDAVVGQFIAYVQGGDGEGAVETDLGALLDQALETRRHLGQRWERRGPAQVRVVARAVSLRRAIDNLLENACKHGAAPFETEIVDETTHFALVVRDRGTGVAPDLLGRLGRPFVRVDAARNGSGSGGTRDRRALCRNPRRRTAVGQSPRRRFRGRCASRHRADPHPTASPEVRSSALCETGVCP